MKKIMTYLKVDGLIGSDNRFRTLDEFCDFFIKILEENNLTFTGRTDIEKIEVEEGKRAQTKT